MNDLLQRIKKQFADGLAASVTESMGTLTLGFWSARGREMPITVEATRDGLVVLTDGGETWSDLANDGFTPIEPSEADARRLISLSELYRVGWDGKHCSFVVLCREHEALDAARRLTMASAALDGWRVWARRPSKMFQSTADLIDETERKAKRAGFEAERNQMVPGKTGYLWSCPLLLRPRTDRSHRAAVRFDDANPEHVLEHTLVYAKDTDLPTVLVTSERNAHALGQSLELRTSRVAVISKMAKGTARGIVKAVTRLVA